jgi:transposase-like protein
VTLSADLLRAAGEALYGHEWQSAIARDLGVNPRMVRFWAAGKREIPEDRLRAVKVLLSRREAIAAEEIMLSRRKVAASKLWEKFEERFPGKY